MNGLLCFHKGCPPIPGSPGRPSLSSLSSLPISPSPSSSGHSPPPAVDPAALPAALCHALLGLVASVSVLTTGLVPDPGHLQHLKLDGSSLASFLTSLQFPRASVARPLGGVPPGPLWPRSHQPPQVSLISHPILTAVAAPACLPSGGRERQRSRWSPGLDPGGL